MNNKQLAQHAQRMRNKFQNSIDIRGHALVRRIDDEFRGLENDANRQKSPASLRHKLQSLGRMIDDADREEVISHMDHDTLRDWVEDCLRVIR